MFEEKVIDKLTDIELAIDGAQSNLVDLGVLYDVENQIKSLGNAVKSNSRISSFQNWIMIGLTIAILYLTYVMANISETKIQ